MTISIVTQCDQIGRFLKFLMTNHVKKPAQMFGDVLGYFDKHYFQSKTDVATFKTNFEKIGLLFITTSGQTDSKAKQATTILK